MGTGFQIVMFLLSTAYQINQSNKMKRAADKRKGFAINKRGEANHIPIVYGKAKVGLIEANHKVSSSRIYAAKGAFGTEFNSKTAINNTAVGSKNEYLIMNGAFCQSESNTTGIDQIVSIEVDESIYDRNKDHKHVIHAYRSGMSTATAPLGAANSLPADNKFTGCAHATMLFQLNRDDYNYNGIPSVAAFVSGTRVRSIIRSGSAGSYTYAFDTNRYYSTDHPSGNFDNDYRNNNRNPALILADYLTSSMGRGLSDSEIDLESFYNSAQVCNSIQDSPTGSTGFEYFGTVNNQKRMEEFETFSDFPGTGSDGDASEAVLYKALDTGKYYNYVASGATGSYVEQVAGISTRALPLYECNIVLDSEAKVRDNIEEILGTMPLAVLHWSSEGRYKLKLEYPTSQSEVDALVVKNLNSDSIVRESVELQWLSASDRFNECTVTYLDEHEDFKENSVQWPPTGSTAHTALLTQDGGQPMKTDINLNGITDPYHALARAEFVVRQSRTFHAISFTATRDALGLEPGDFIKVTLPESDIDNNYVVRSVKVNQDFTVLVDAAYFDLNALAWNVEDHIIPTGVLVPPIFDTKAPSNIVWTSGQSELLGSFSGKLTWTAADDINVRDYIVEASTDGGTTFIQIGTTVSTSFDVAGLKANTYIFSVRSRSIVGKLSTRSITSSQVLSHVGVDNLVIIYASSEDQATNVQTYDNTLSMTTYPYYATYVYNEATQPVLPIRPATATLVFAKREADDPRLQTFVYCYQRAYTAPSIPTGGSFSFSTNTLTPPTGWYDQPPAGFGDVYISTSYATGLDGTVDNTLVWSTPTVLVKEGTIARELSVYARSASTPSTPTGGSYDFSSESLVVPSSGGSLIWTRYVPGGPGTVYVSNTSAEGPPDSIDTTLTWSSPAVLGAEGADGSQKITGRVYYQTLAASGSAPSTPTATSIDAATGAFTGLTSGWSTTQPTIVGTNTSNLEWSSLFVATIPATGSQTINFGTPEGAIQVASTIQSDNYQTGVSGWSIDRATGTAEFGSAIIRDQLSIGQIPVSSINTSAINNNSGFITSSALNGYATTTQLNAKNRSTASSSNPSGGATVGDRHYNTSTQKNWFYSSSGWTQANLIAEGVETNWLSAQTISADSISGGTLSANLIELDNITLDTNASNELVIKTGGVSTPYIAANALSDVVSTYVSSATFGTGYPGTTVATVNVSGNLGDKFLITATVNYFTHTTATAYVSAYVFLNSAAQVYTRDFGRGISSTSKSGFSLVGVNVLNANGTVPVDFNLLSSAAGSSTGAIFLRVIRLKR
jgi:hypothetical protein